MNKDGDLGGIRKRGRGGCRDRGDKGEALHFGVFSAAGETLIQVICDILHRWGKSAMRRTTHRFGSPDRGAASPRAAERPLQLSEPSLYLHVSCS